MKPAPEAEPGARGAEGEAAVEVGPESRGVLSDEETKESGGFWGFVEGIVVVFCERGEGDGEGRSEKERSQIIPDADDAGSGDGRWIPKVR